MDGLVDDENCEGQERGAVGQGGEDLGSLQSVGQAAAGRPLGQAEGDQ